MSQSSDIVRLGLEIFEREGPASMLPLAAEDVEVYTEPGLINAGTYTGHDGFMHWTEAWLEAWDDFRMEALEFIEVGDEIVVTPVRQIAMGKTSGVPVEQDITYLVQIRDGKVVRLHLYVDRERALEVARELAAGTG
jgi:ketosteroid isomerase-like protein